MAQRAIWTTYIGLWVQSVIHAFWGLLSLVILVIGLLVLGAFDRLSLDALWFTGLGSLAMLIASLVWGWVQFRRPTLQQAIHLIDEGLSDRPFTAIQDPDFAKIRHTDDPSVAFLWARHRDQMQAKVARAVPVLLPINLMRRDPFALRYVAILVFVTGGLFGSLERMREVGAPMGAAGATALGPAWEAWITPPAYTKQTALYLNDLTERDTLVVMKDSAVQIRLYGQTGDHLIEETVSARTDAPAASAMVQDFKVMRQGDLVIAGDQGAAWSIQLQMDDAPVVQVFQPYEADFFGQSTLNYSVRDDFGATKISGTIALDLGRVDRLFGLAADPDFDRVAEFDLPLPLTGKADDFQDVWIDDHSQSPMVHLPVVLTITARDAIDQAGQASMRDIMLPGRRFFDPLAAALIEVRRDLLWSLQNSKRAARMIRAITYDPQGAFRSDTDYLRLRYILRQIEQFQDSDLMDEKRTEIAQALWDLALSIEEGDVNDALDRMRKAQDRLSQAMKNGASQPEIEKLMQELRQANENYIRQLRQQAERDQKSQNQDMAQNSPQDQMQMNQSDLQKMMDRIQELMEQGRMAEAQQALEELQQIMENMQVAEGQSGEQGQDDALGGLSDTLREQQDLSDDAFRNLQNQDGDGQGTQDLANRQQDLRDQLENNRRSLPNLNSEEAQRAERSLDQAERSMRQAEDALRQDDLGRAIENQADAMEALREGIRDMDRALAQSQNPENGQGMAENDSDQQRDPLGRPQGRDGNAGTADANQKVEDIARQAEEVLNEIRRRAGDVDRPQSELNYLRRLLELF